MRKISVLLPSPTHCAPPSIADANALKTVYEGSATPDQQKRAMDFILSNLCAVKVVPYAQVHGDASFVAGRQFVGKTIASIITTPLANWKDVKND